MIYFYAEDEFYYSSTEKSNLLASYDGVKDILAMPTKEEIREIVRKGDCSTALMAPYFPSQIDQIFDKTGFFEIIILKNRHGILTSGQKNAGISVEKALKEKLGINIHRPSMTLKDYGGADRLIEEAKKIGIKERYKFSVKGFMITGIPGTGKSFFAKCLAGETNRLLVELNLSQLMEQDNTIYLINMIFDFFQENEGQYIIWVDEIEKMIIGEKAKQVLGIMLTRINELNAESGSNIFFVATANNISDIAKSNPEFLRNGRFDVLVFIMPPKEADAYKIFDIYTNKVRKQFEQNTIWSILLQEVLGEKEEEGSRAGSIQSKFRKFLKKDKAGKFKKIVREADIIELSHKDEEFGDFVKTLLEEYAFTFLTKDFIRKAMVVYRANTEAGRFIYTPAEIEFIVTDTFFSYYFFKNYLKEDGDVEETYQALVEKYKPLQATLSSAIAAMKGVASSFDTI